MRCVIPLSGCDVDDVTVARQLDRISKTETGAFFILPLGLLKVLGRLIPFPKLGIDCTLCHNARLYFSVHYCTGTARQLQYSTMQHRTTATFWGCQSSRHLPLLLYCTWIERYLEMTLCISTSERWIATAQLVRWWPRRTFKNLGGKMPR